MCPFPPVARHGCGRREHRPVHINERPKLGISPTPLNVVLWVSPRTLAPRNRPLPPRRPFASVAGRPSLPIRWSGLGSARRRDHAAYIHVDRADLWRSRRAESGERRAEVEDRAWQAAKRRGGRAPPLALTVPCRGPKRITGAAREELGYAPGRRLERARHTRATLQAVQGCRRRLTT